MQLTDRQKRLFITIQHTGRNGACLNDLMMLPGYSSHSSSETKIRGQLAPMIEGGLVVCTTGRNSPGQKRYSTFEFSKPIMLKCLMCGNEFGSKDKVNERVCGTCKTRGAWLDGCDYSVVEFGGLA